LSQARSRKKLIAVLLFGAVLLAAPLLWNGWTSGHELSGKGQVFDAVSQRPVKDLVGCLVQRPAGGLSLSIMTVNHFADPARGLVVRIEPQPSGARLRAWLEEGKTLTSSETAQLAGCAG
jgi:hypothetical protein